jgi:hypothetical protein
MGIDDNVMAESIDLHLMRYLFIRGVACDVTSCCIVRRRSLFAL